LYGFAPVSRKTDLPRTTVFTDSMTGVSWSCSARGKSQNKLTL
jgi:hypothetical protein